MRKSEKQRRMLGKRRKRERDIEMMSKGWRHEERWKKREQIEEG